MRVSISSAFAAVVVGVGILVASAAQGAPTASTDGVWSDVRTTAIPTRGTIYIRPDEFRTIALDDNRLRQVLSRVPLESQGGAGTVLSLPMPDGTFQAFEIFESPVMAKELADKFGQIRTYAGHGLDDTTAFVRLDRTPLGFHAMIRGASGTIYVDPYQLLNGRVSGTEYMSYFTHDYRRSADRHYQCDIHKLDEYIDAQPKASPLPGANRTPIGPQLHTYRTAVATTGEYTSFHGGTVNAGLAAVVTAMNRVTGLYQAELAIRFELIADNDLLIFTNAATDGYTNSNGFTMLGQNQAKLDSIIGSGGYDIGHVFSTGGGGVAGLGVVCLSGNKARGVTGLPSPIGDPFYVDFVAHEMGHQFGANHSFNGTAGSCGGGNRNGSTAYEPGSGSTIMAYAGICSSHNIQNFSDDHFHTISFDEIVSFTNFGAGSICDAVTNTGNQAPVVEAGAAFTVPIDTPLKLTGSASDPDGHTLVYRWEQFDLGPGGSPQAPTGNAPLFRSFSAVATPVRYLPKLNDILNNTQTIGENPADYTRNIRFRLTALDQQTAGGGIDYDVVTHSVTDAAGPFRITSQGIATSWTPGTQETVTWDVANTDQAPVNCASVNILLSTDLGQSFVNLLALFTPNDGSESFVVPDLQTTIGRVSVECADNIFLDINNGNITIESAPDPDFGIFLSPDPVNVCAPDNGVINIDVTSIGGFTGPVTLSTAGNPAGTSTSFSANPVNAGNSTVLTIGNTGAASAGTYSIDVSGTATPGTDNALVTLNLSAGLAAAPTPDMPVNGATFVDRMPTLSWNPVTGADVYLVEIATDSGFGSIVYTASEGTTSHSVTSLLGFSTEYFWRVTAQNFCGDSVSVTFSFTTQAAPQIVCGFPFASIPDNGAAITDTVNLPNVATVADLNVFVDVTHPVVADLIVDITNESTGTTVSLIDRPGIPLFATGCTFPDISTTIDDEAASAAEDACAAPAPALGDSLTPNGSLTDVDGETVNGGWTISVRDAKTGDTGTLSTWCVIIELGAAVVDTDNDGVADDSDNCTIIANADQRDTNGDGYGNVCDPDLNNDGVVNALDLGLFKAVFFTADADADFDGSGIVNAVDLGVLKQFFFMPPGPSGIAP